LIVGVPERGEPGNVGRVEPVAVRGELVEMLADPENPDGDDAAEPDGRELRGLGVDDDVPSEQAKGVLARNQRKKSFVKRCRRVSGAVANGVLEWLKSLITLWC
jgi:hypothetical protein